jgi:VWFA-related protein
LLLLAPHAVAQQVPVFATRLERVRLDVSVTRDGTPVPGLSAEDFEVFDDGVRQEVELATSHADEIHAVLALDTSSSVAGEKLARLKSAAQRFVEALGPDDSLSILTFSECLELLLLDSRDREQARTAIGQAGTRRTTSLHDAALASLIVADPAHGRPLVLVFSDGEDVGSWAAPEPALALARESEAVVHAVVPAGQAPSGILQELTSQTGGRVWQTAAADSLDRVFLGALEEFRSRYRLQYEPRGVVREGWHRLRVRLRGGEGTVRARPGYTRRAGS